MTPEEQKKEEDKKKKPSYALPIALGAIGAGTALAGGLLISPRMRGAAKRFMEAHSKINKDESVDPVKDLNTYIEGGSEMASGKILGVIPVPTFMKGVRLSQFTPEQWRYWNPDTSNHYTDFAAGPASSYFRFLQEHVDSEKKHHIGKSILPSFFNPSWWAKHKAEKLPGKGKQLVADASTKLLENLKGMEGKYDPTLMKVKLEEAFKQMAGVDDISKVTLDQQRKLFPQFDEYVKKIDPNLWKQKYLTDFTQGAVRVPTSLNSYADLIGPVTTAQNALIGGGAAIAGTGGLLAWIRSRRAKKEEEKEKEKVADDIYDLSAGLYPHITQDPAMRKKDLEDKVNDANTIEDDGKSKADAVISSHWLAMADPEQAAAAEQYRQGIEVSKERILQRLQQLRQRLDDTGSLWGGSHKTAELSPSYKLVFYKNRSTPQVIRADRAEEPRPKNGYGEVTGKRDASEQESKKIEKGNWLRVDLEGRKPSDPLYKITEYRKQLGEKRRIKLQEKQASILTAGKALIGAGRKLWNPNLNNELFGSAAARSARQKGVAFLEPSFLNQTGGIMAQARKWMDKSKLLKPISDRVLPVVSTVGDVVDDTTGVLRDKIRSKGFVFNSSPMTKDFMAQVFGGKLPKKINTSSYTDLDVAGKIEGSKILESKVFPEIGSTKTLGQALRGNKNETIEEALKRRYPNGWVAKRSRGGSSLQTIGTKNQTIFLSGGDTKGINGIPRKEFSKWIVQEDKGLQDKNPILSFLNNKLFGKYQKTLSGKQEYRVHVINGKVVPYATIDRGGAIESILTTLLPSRTKKTRMAEEFAQSVINKIKEPSIRKHQYGFDVGFNRSGAPVLIETNAAGNGISGYTKHPIVQDAIAASIKGKLPAHVLARRAIYGAGAAGTTYGVGSTIYQHSKET